ncbi:hypothetical protein CCR95_20995 [Thiocystis minor]|nr:hypothetical protein [Thiocystis minor]
MATKWLKRCQRSSGNAAIAIERDNRTRGWFQTRPNGYMSRCWAWRVDGGDLRGAMIDGAKTTICFMVFVLAE